MQRRMAVPIWNDNHAFRQGNSCFPIYFRTNDFPKQCFWLSNDYVVEIIIEKQKMASFYGRVLISDVY